MPFNKGTYLFPAALMLTTLTAGAVVVLPGGQPASAHTAETVKALLHNRRVSIYPDGRQDLAAGRIDERVVQLLQRASQNYTFTVNSLKTGHTVYVYGTNKVSNHTRGRAFDISIVNGKPVRPNTAIANEFRAHLMRLTRGVPIELGGPWTTPCATHVDCFTDARHQDHIHLGFLTKGPALPPVASKPAGVFEQPNGPKTGRRVTDAPAPPTAPDEPKSGRRATDAPAPPTAPDEPTSGRRPSDVTGGAPPGDPGNCRVYVRATRVARGVWHLFIVHTDADGRQTGFRGGPSKRAGGNIVTTVGSYDASFPDWSPKAPSKTVMSGAAACPKNACFTSEAIRIDATKTRYRALGTNSNSVASTLLKQCGVPRDKPNKTTPGWNDGISTAPVCVRTKSASHWNGFHVHIKNTCSYSVRVKPIISRWPDGSCKGLKPGESYTYHGRIVRLDRC